MRASSSSEPGAFSAMVRSSSRLPAERTLAKNSVEVNQTFGSLAAIRLLPWCHRHCAGLHVFVAGDAHFQGRHRITPLACNTASTVFPETTEHVAASGMSIVEPGNRRRPAHAASASNPGRAASRRDWHPRHHELNLVVKNQRKSPLAPRQGSKHFQPQITQITQIFRLPGRRLCDPRGSRDLRLKGLLCDKGAEK